MRKVVGIKSRDMADTLASFRNPPDDDVEPMSLAAFLDARWALNDLHWCAMVHDWMDVATAPTKAQRAARERKNRKRIRRSKRGWR